MKATNNGSLAPLPRCIIDIPKAGIIRLNNLPDISDSKDAIYNNEAIIGRSTPLYTYSHSGDRTIGIQMHFFVIDQGDAGKNLQYLRWIQSALYPRPSNGQSPFEPPVVCQITCGSLLSGNPKIEQSSEPLCCILKSYSVKFPTEVAWDEETFCPFKFDVETSWIVVYASDDLPFQDRIVKSGR
jgi:hypothetical protein